MRRRENNPKNTIKFHLDTSVNSHKSLETPEKKSMSCFLITVFFVLKFSESNNYLI